MHISCEAIQCDGAAMRWAGLDIACKLGSGDAIVNAVPHGIIMLLVKNLSWELLVRFCVLCFLVDFFRLNPKPICAQNISCIYPISYSNRARVCVLRSSAARGS